MSRLPSLPALLGAVFLTLSTGGAVAAKADPKPDASGAKPAKAEKGEGKASKATASSEKAASKADPPPAGSSPMAELKRSNEKLDKILQKNRPNWSPEAELQRAEVRKVVGSFLDYGELAHRSLAKHWDGINTKQRDEFVDTLRELVERSYLRQVHGNANYNIKYDKETKQDSEADVTGVLNTTARGKKVKIALEYKMLWKGDHWVVYDVVTDEQSMLENYRAEFNKIINKDGFEALLKRMKKKLAEKEEE
ncbi:MAG TPA: ABC transporter substrate-binding protein [Polyangia bacterium]|nr:ABC transporter substrate-binding protein [Polyangia bacterium]